MKITKLVTTQPYKTMGNIWNLDKQSSLINKRGPTVKLQTLYDDPPLHPGPIVATILTLSKTTK